MQIIQVYPMENYDVAVYFVDGNYDPYNCLDIDSFVIYEKGISIEDPLKSLA